MPLSLPLALAAGLGAVLMLVVLLLRVAARADRVTARLEAVQRAAGLDQVKPQRSSAVSAFRLLGMIGAAMLRARVLPAKTVRELEQTLAAAGFRGDRALAVFLGAKVAMLVGLPLLAVLLLDQLGVGQPWTFQGVLGAAVLGLLLPDIIARRLRNRYLAELERAMPDALDLMIICAEAGLPLESAVERVAEEIRPASPAVATEFALCASELRILSDRRQALTNLATRTGLDLARRLAMTLSQSMQFGTPLVGALRTLAAEMRQEQLVRFEARAAKLPVLLTVPMIVCILPTLFLVVAGPAMLKVFRAW